MIQLTVLAIGGILLTDTIFFNKILYPPIIFSFRNNNCSFQQAYFLSTHNPDVREGLSAFHNMDILSLQKIFPEQSL